MKSLLKSFPYSLRLTLPLLILGLGSGLNFISFQQINKSSSDRVYQEGIQRADFTAGQTAAFLDYLYRESQTSSNNEGINLILSQIRGESNLKTILLTNEKNEVLISNQQEYQSKNISETSFSKNIDLINQVRNRLVGQTLVADHEQDIKQLNSFYPVTFGRESKELKSSRVGVLVLTYSLQKPLQQSIEDARQKGLIMSAILGIIGLFLWGLLHRLITRRANRLVAISQSWSNGLLSNRVTLSGSDEFAKIGMALNCMASSLEIGTEAIKSSELQLRERSEELETTLTRLQSTQSQLVQTEKMSGLGQMVAGIAHEVNNPIGFIHGNLAHVNGYAKDLLHLVTLYQKYYPQPIEEIEAAIEDIDLEFLRKDFPNIMNSMKIGTDRVKEIVLSLRNFSRLDESANKAVDLHEGIESTLLILQHRFKSAATQIKLIKQYADLPLVHCYAGQINQVLMNILGNALDAITEQLVSQPDYLPEITIRTEKMNPDRVCIIIIDNGPGIPESVQRRLFDPFFTTKEVGKGTGLGLSISYQIVVEKHHGKIECRSNPTQGTEFWIELPIGFEV